MLAKMYALTEIFNLQAFSREKWENLTICKVLVVLVNPLTLSAMCRLNRQHILLWMTYILLNGGSCCGDSNSSTPITANNTPTNATENKNFLTKELTLFILIGLPVMGFLLLLSLTCQCISCIYIMSRKAEPTVIASPKEDKEQTIVAGEEELWYTTVKFNKEAKNPDQMTNFDQKSEYATVVIKTPDRRSLQLDLADEAEESNEICID